MMISYKLPKIINRQNFEDSSELRRTVYIRNVGKPFRISEWNYNTWLRNVSKPDIASK